jgi:ABC-type transport system involved in multi-copper enzyme maturation permease subunit
MLPGPVFQVELITTARRRRYFFLRVLYGLILLLVVWFNYTQTFWRASAGSGELSVHQMSQFAGQTFAAFLTTQTCAVLLLTPALVAGVIADEKQRKTLHYLLASQLTSGEIVLGKLLARMLHIAVFLTVGLPVMSLLSLIGGVDPVMVLATFLGTFSAMTFLAGLSIFVSTIARRVRDAVLVAYLLIVLFLAVPPLIAGLLSYWPNLLARAAPFLEWIFAAHPLFMAPVSFGRVAGPGSEIFVFARMAGFQVLYGLLFVALAIWRLRPSFRDQQEARRGRLWRLRALRLRLIPRPSCGADPMLWKELHVTRLAGMTRVAATLVSLTLLSALGYFFVDFGWPALKDLLFNGYGWAPRSSERLAFNGYLRFACTALYVLMGLGVASMAASVVSSEREEDTWTSLTATVLTGTEILRAKMLGAVWGVRWFLLPFFAFATMGLVVESVHPFGFVAMLIVVPIFLWFVSALGTYCSLTCRTTTRALAWTVGLLILTNGAYIIPLIMVEVDTPLLLVPGCTPFVVALSLLSYQDVWSLLGFEGDGYYGGSPFSGSEGGEFAAACVLSVAFYAFAAMILTVLAFAAFDKLVDRPRRPLFSAPTPAKKPRPLEV